MTRFRQRLTYAGGPALVEWRDLVRGASLDEVVPLRALLARSVRRRRIAERRMPCAVYGTRAVRAKG